MSARWAAIGTVLRKEITDALRDRRTLAVMLLSSVLLGPLLLIALSGQFAALEAGAERREVWVSGMEHAPGLRNYFERQTLVVREAPPDHEAQLRASRLAEPVLVVPQDFEAALKRGESPTLLVLSDSANRRAEAGTARLNRWLAGYVREQALLRLAWRGVAAELLEPAQVQAFDLASPQARATQLSMMVPFFVLMAVLFGGLSAALDSTAGERERGSLEPLLMNPIERPALVLGKWGAVAGVAMLVAVLSCLSFIPAQWLLRSDTLQALFQYGWSEALQFLMVLLPFAAAVSALLMAVAQRCRSVKEAQAASSVVVMSVSLLPMINLFSLSGEAAWQLGVPALAQSVVMTRVLKGELITAPQAVVPTLVCLLLTLVCLWDVARQMRLAGPR
jgi:sodium transport system permease protein